MSVRRKNLILLAALLLVFAVVLFAVALPERNRTEQARGVPTQEVGRLKRVSYQGEIYREKPAMTSILLIGTDRPEGSVGYGARQGGQADFLMLLVIDDNEKTVHRLHIDRDTMTAVETLGVLGNPIGTKEMQICLAHAFGTTPEENSRSVKRAVENLLEGIEIDYYLCMSMDSIGALNDALGGVTVTLTEDLSGFDPQVTSGATVKLNAAQTELLVRTRMQIGDGTNESRMRRQRLFLEAAGETLKRRIQEEPEFLNGFLDDIEAVTTMNIQRSWLMNELGAAYRYEMGPIGTLDGGHVIGRDGFVEFHPTPGAAAEWVVDVFFEKEDV